MGVAAGITNTISPRVICRRVRPARLHCRRLLRSRKTSIGAVRSDANLEQSAGNLAHAVSDDELFRGARAALLRRLSRAERALSETEVRRRIDRAAR